MGFENKRYQLGSYVNVKHLGVSSIKGMDDEMVTIYSDEKLPWHYIKPLEISEDHMIDIGFELLKKISNPHHMDINMCIRINGRFYFARGIVYDDKSIWSFYGSGVRYVHQLQQLIWIIEPTFKINLATFHQ
jgi:hypothetical protein